MISKKINKIYSGRFIVIIIQNFVVGTTYMYCAITQAFEPEILVVGIFKIPFWICFFRYSISSFLTILTAIYPCEGVINEVSFYRIQHVRSIAKVFSLFNFYLKLRKALNDSPKYCSRNKL